MAKGGRWTGWLLVEVRVMRSADTILAIHAERGPPRRTTPVTFTGEPCAVKAASTVRRGGVGKGPRDLAGHLPYHIAGRASVYFLRGRLRFGEGGNSAPFPSALAVWGAVPE